MSVVVQPTVGALAEAVERLRAGRLVAFPTETVYGLAAPARDVTAVEAVYRAKGRPASHPLIVHLANRSGLAGWAREVPAAASALADALWPGPLTLVLRRASDVPDSVTGGQDTVALRVPDHPVALALLAAVPEGLAAPSANRFGHVSPTRAQHVAEEFPDLDLYILDGGPCKVGLESTIIDLSGDRPRLLRPGGVAVEAIERILGRDLAGSREREGGPPGRDVPRVPGSLPSHYAPRAPARGMGAEGLRRVAASLDPTIVVLSRQSAPPEAACRWLELPRDAASYAQEFYDALRRADGPDVTSILIEHVPDGPAWRAIRDRIRRATAAHPAPTAGEVRRF